MKRFNLIHTLAVLTLAFTCTSILAQQSATSTLTGKWRITWLNGGTPNKIQLTDSNGTLTGTFTEDNGENCPITGISSTTSSPTTITLTVTCSKFSVQIQGTLKDNFITGNYLAYGNSGGGFKMEKLICMLPEGCNNQ